MLGMPDLDPAAFQHVGDKRIKLHGGGGGGDTTATTYTSNVPDYAQQPFMNMIGQAEALTNEPYQAYPGERVAQFTPLQQQASQSVGQMQPSEQTGLGSSLAAAGGLQALQASQSYTPTKFSADTITGGKINNLTMAGPANVQAQQYAAPNMQAAQANAPQQYASPDMQAAQTSYGSDLANRLSSFQMGAPSQVSTGAFIDPGTAQQYMSPYIEQALAPQLRELTRQSNIQGTRDQAAATQAGAYGGSRQAIVQAERERNLGQLQSDVLAKGYQSAFEQAANQYSTDAARQMQAQQANQQAGLTASSANQQAALGVQQLGVSSGLQAALANLSNQQQANVQNQAAQLQTQGLNAQQAMQVAMANQQAQQQANVQNQASQLQTQGLNAQQAMQAALANQQMQYDVGAQNLQAGLTAQQQRAANELAVQQANQQAGLEAQRLQDAANQQAANIGLQGAQAAFQGAATLGNLGQQDFGQQMDIANLQNQIGTQQQANVQNVLDQQYQDFLNQQNAPYQQIGFMSDLLRGSGSTTRQVYPEPSMASQLVGAGTAAAGLSGLMKKAGGTVRAPKKRAGLADLAVARMK